MKIKRTIDRWWKDAICAQIDPELWLLPDVESRRLAQHICLNHCPVLAKCLEDARQHSTHGVVMGGIIWPDNSASKMTRYKLLSYCVMCGGGKE